MQAINGCLSFRIRSHFHKTETFASPRVTIHYDLRALNLTISREQLFQTRTIDAETQVSTIQFPSHYELQKLREEFGLQPFTFQAN